jgi:hypothetical protein
VIASLLYIFLVHISEMVKGAFDEHDPIFALLMESGKKEE